MNSKLDDEEEEIECDGDEGNVCDLELFVVRFPIVSATRTHTQKVVNRRVVAQRVRSVSE